MKMIRSQRLVEIALRQTSSRRNICTLQTYPEELISFFKCRVLLTHSKLYLLTRGITFLCILWILRPRVWKSDLLHSKHQRPDIFPELETMQITDTDSPRIKTATCQRMLCRMCTSLHQSTVEFSIKVCMNKFCVRPWQPRHKGPFTVNLS